MAIEKFDPKELGAKGVYATHGTDYGYPFTEIEILNKPVTPKENFNLFMERKEFYWVPNISYDFNKIFPEDVIPDCKAVSFSGGLDSFGVEWIPVKSNLNLPALVKPGNPKLTDITKWEDVIEFPDVASWDWASGRKAFDKALYPERVNLGYCPNGFFERLLALMDFENAAMALLDEPECVAAFFEKMADYNISLIEHYKKYFAIDIVWVSDDWGSQRAPFFSKNIVREIIVPAYKRVVDRAHEIGVYIITHSCGHIETLVPEIIELGTDIWQPQVEINPIIDIISEYGEKLMINACGFFEDIADIDEFRRVNTEKCKIFLSTKRFFVEYVSWCEDAKEKDRIIYELLRKTATGEII
jgi:hypothetical protein